MPPDNLLTDDYVAELLAKEASDCSLKYSAMGLDAYKSTKRPANQPKPNTRFLNNIIRDTNSHNRALLAKENAESRARLQELEAAEEQKRREEDQKLRRARPGPSDTRKRMLGDIAAHLGGPSKRRKTESAEGAVKNASDSKAWSSFAKSSSERTTATPRNDIDGSANKFKELFVGPSGVYRSRPIAERGERSSRREDITDDSTRRPKGLSSEKRDDHKRTHHGRNGDDGGKKAPPVSEQRKPRHHSPVRKGDSTRNHETRRKDHSSTQPSSHKYDSDSDPLDDIIGPVPEPPPAVRRRGRGAASTGASGIDSRFAADYDPRLDVTPEPDDGLPKNVGGVGADWDNAVEAFRDRVKWQQQGAERLRSAGFTEDEIRKWEKGGRKDESDVTWTKAGGLREWDRGKVVDDDGDVTVETEWGRLKDTE